MLSDTVLNFIRSHPLMDEAVGHENDRPVFYKRDLIFTHLVVDKIKIELFRNQLQYTVFYVFYAATSKLQIFRLWPSFFF